MEIEDGQLDDLEDLPTSIIVANMEPGVFSNMELRVGRQAFSGSHRNRVRDQVLSEYHVSDSFTARRSEGT